MSFGDATLSRNHEADYGAYLHAKGVSPKTELVFYDVPIDHVSLTDVPSLTTLVNRLENGAEYAISFGFTNEAAAHLIASFVIGLYITSTMFDSVSPMTLLRWIPTNA